MALDAGAGLLSWLAPCRDRCAGSAQPERLWRLPERRDLPACCWLRPPALIPVCHLVRTAAAAAWTDGTG